MTVSGRGAVSRAVSLILVALPDGTKTAEIEAVLTYHHRPGEKFVVRRAVRKVPFR